MISKYYERVNTKVVDIDNEIPFDIPSSWNWVRLGNCMLLLSGRDLTPREYSSRCDGIPYITGASNFVNNQLTINRWTTSPVTISSLGDLLITCKGTIGEMAFNHIGAIHIARQIMAIETYSGIDSTYLMFYLKSQLSTIKKSANSMIPGISRNILLNMLLPLPPLDEQKRIVQKINLLFDSLK